MLLSTVFREFKHHGLVLPSQNLHLFKCGGFSSNKGLCHLTLFIPQLTRRLLCLLLHSLRALCLWATQAEGPLRTAGDHPRSAAHYRMELCRLSWALLSKGVSVEDSLIAALSLVHCSSFTLAHPRTHPYLLESECYSSLAARGRREVSYMFIFSKTAF